MLKLNNGNSSNLGEILGIYQSYFKKDYNAHSSPHKFLLKIIILFLIQSNEELNNSTIELQNRYPKQHQTDTQIELEFNIVLMAR